MHRNEYSGHSNGRRELGLVFHGWDASKWGARPLPYFGVDWPQNSPLLIATLDTFEIPRPGPIYASFIKANTPSDCKIYFATVKEDGHDTLQRILQSTGSIYQEHTSPASARSRIADVLSGRFSTKRKTLIASTKETSVMDDVFNEYWKEWYITSEFPFIIAPRDFEGWANQLRTLVSRTGHRTLFAATIENSHCIISTRWEHGMILVSGKISHSVLAERTRMVAAANHLSLTVTEAENEGDSSGLRPA